jgi:hypothetical protein
MTGMTEIATSSQESTVFEEHAGRVIARLRKSVGDLVGAIPSLEPIPRPVDLGHCLGIDSKLAWKISNFLSIGDPFAAAQYVPGTAGFRIFLRAAGRKDLGKSLVASARAAFDGFVDLVDTHAGSRKAFDMMLAGHVQANRSRMDLEHRRMMFLGGSYVWGVQARVAVRIDILTPSTDPMKFDLTLVRGFVDLRRLRPNVPWRVWRGFSVDDTGVAHTSVESEPLDPAEDGEISSSSVPLVRDFCSRPLPRFRAVEGIGGIVEYELIEGEVGNTGILTCITGETLRRVEPRYRMERYHDLCLLFRIRTPSELAIGDILVHRGLFGDGFDPRLRVYSDLFTDVIAPKYRSSDLIPTEERVERLGPATDPPARSEIPRHGELVRRALARGGWKAADFDLYRVQMRYPPFPSTLMVTDELPMPPPSRKKGR